MTKQREVAALPLPPAIELWRVVRMAEAERLTGVSRDTLRRHYRDKIIKISPGCDGMRVGDCLQIGGKFVAA